MYARHVAPLAVDLANRTARLGGQRDRVFSFEYVNGTGFADDLRGDRCFNFMSGYGGNDRLTGRGSRDFLFGDDGNDVVSGGGRDDILAGGGGTDRGTGGAGEDYCSFFESAAGCEHR